MLDGLTEAAYIQCRKLKPTILKSLIVPIVVVLLAACNSEPPAEKELDPVHPLVGTWKLLKGTTIQENDTVVTDYTNNSSFIKIINDTHFAFLNHDLKKGKDSSAAVFVAGGGTYTLTGNTYTESLEYCTARDWEGNDFTFTLSFKGDTLTQQGTEVVESAGVNRINIEQYVRIR